ncbi:MAG: YCF48-related protein [Bacteroidales bacterium]
MISAPPKIFTGIFPDEDHVGKAGTTSHITEMAVMSWRATIGNFMACGCSLFDPLNGILIGYDKIAKSTDGGYSWQIVSSVPGYYLRRFCFLNNQTGWAVADDGKVSRTDDGGSTWTQSTTGTYWDLKDVCFVDEHKGWVVSNYGQVFFSDDGGTSWEEQVAYVENELRAICRSANNHVWAVGKYGTIIHNTDEIFTGLDEPAVSNNSEDLVSVYPNPFDREIKIAFNFSSDQPVEIKLYNLQGMLIQQYKSVSPNAETAIISIPASDLARGVYLLELRSGVSRVWRKVVKD